MKTPKIPKSKPKPSKSTLLSKPIAKPKSIIFEPNPYESDELQAKLNKSDPDIQYFIAALKIENLKFQKQIAKCQAEKISLENQITLLTEEYAQYRHDNPPFDPATASEEIKRLEKELQEFEAKEKETTEQAHRGDTE